MEQKNQVQSIWAEVEPYCVIHRIWQNLWMVLLSAGLFALCAYIATVLFVHPRYTCTATFVVTPKYSSSVYSTGTSAITASTAEQFASLLSSSTMVRRVRRTCGADVDGASVSSSAVEGTNLIQLWVTGPNPRSAYYMCTGILDNYEEYAQYVFDSVMLETVTSPSVPDKLEYRATQRKAILIAAPAGGLAMVILLAVLTITSGTIQTGVGARNQVDGTLLVTLNHQRKRKTLKSLFRRKKTALLISNPTTSFVYVESLHQLRARIEHTHRHKGYKTFLVTSVSENEGKSTVAANLALSLARRHKKVLLVDCDLRKSAQHLIFEAVPDKNATINALLRGNLAPDQLVKAIQYRKAENLFFLFATNVQRHSAELLGSGQMKQLLEVLRENFDYVILDSSPMGFFTDSEVLSDLTDASLLVVRQDIQPDRIINDAIDGLNRCNAEFLGFVYNDVHTFNVAAGIIGGRRYGYGYGYGRGYGYGYGYGSSKAKQYYSKDKESVELSTTSRQKES